MLSTEPERVKNVNVFLKNDSNSDIPFSTRIGTYKNKD